MSKLNAAIAAASAEIRSIQKSGWNDFHKYRYPTDNDIMSAVRGPMAAQGLVMTCVEVSQRSVEVAQTKRGNENRVTAQYTFHVRVAESDEVMPVVVWAGGADAGEKGDFKALTGAKKYALSLVFALAAADTQDEAGGGGDDDTALQEARRQLEQAFAEGNDRGKLIERIVRAQLTRFAPDVEAWTEGKSKSVNDLRTDDMKKYWGDLQNCVLLSVLDDWRRLLEEHVVTDDEAAKMVAAYAVAQGLEPVGSADRLPAKTAAVMVVAAKRDWPKFSAGGKS